MHAATSDQRTTVRRCSTSVGPIAPSGRTAAIASAGELDMFALRLPPGTSLMELTDDHRPPVFGSRQSVVQGVLAAAPFADVCETLPGLTCRGRTLLRGKRWCERRRDRLMYHARAGTGAVPFILDVFHRPGIDAWDINEGQPL